MKELFISPSPFTPNDLRETLEVLEQNQETLHYESVEHENHLAKVSIVGSGMVSNPGVAANMFTTLKRRRYSY